VTLQAPTLRPRVAVGPAAAVGVLGGALLAIAAAWLGSEAAGLVGLLTLVNIGLCTFGIGRSVTRGTRPAALVFYTFVLAWIVLPSAYLVGSGRAAWGDVYVMKAPSVTLAAQGVTLLAVAAFLAGSWRRPTEVIDEDDDDRPPVAVRDERRRRYIRGLIVTGIVVLPMVTVLNGGLANFFLSRSDRAAALAAAGIGSGASGAADVGLVRLLPMALAVAALYLCLVEVRALRHSGAPVDPALVWLLVGAAFLWIVYANPISNSRYTAIAPILAFALLLWRWTRPRAGLVLAVGLLMGLYVLYPLANVFRTTQRSDTLTDVGLDVIAGPDFDGFQQVANTLIYVERYGLEWGHTLVSAALFFVPRGIWTDKSLPASIPVADARGYSFTDLSEPLHAELYLNFGVAGVVVGLFLLGRVWARLDAAHLRSATTRLSEFVPYVAFAQLGLIRGPLGSLTPVFVTTGVLIWIGLKRSSAREASS